MANSVEVPVMTLGGCVFLPGQYLPLRIFEARYRRMLLATLEGSGEFAVSMRDDSRVDETDDEPSCPFTCIGRIAGHVSNDDGTFDVVLEGVRRARVLGRVRSEPYPVLGVELVPTGEDEVESREVRSMISACSRLLAGGGAEGAAVLRRFESLSGSPGCLADAVAGIFFDDSKVRRRVLEMVSGSERFQYVLKLLVRMGWRSEIERSDSGGLGLN
jgi:ATP-dependent Lon protease